ncbi:MAG TPA: hypothetical protein VE621_00445 [Bryobacteraceae bacterium]|jgi:hypothetical protein|nr:hypothetical protein [Bryobacteraceae bacterium]
MPDKDSERDASILERGDIFFFYRPRVCILLAKNPRLKVSTTLNDPISLSA